MVNAFSEKYRTVSYQCLYSYVLQLFVLKRRRLLRCFIIFISSMLFPFQQGVTAGHDLKVKFRKSTISMCRMPINHLQKLLLFKEKLWEKPPSISNLRFAPVEIRTSVTGCSKLSIMLQLIP